jgi:hypothetical protein
MSAGHYVNVARSVSNATPIEQDRAAPPAARRRSGPDCGLLADQIFAAAKSLWDDRWGAFYGPTARAIVGGASKKTVAEKIGLAAVVTAIALRAATPTGARWDAELRTDQDDQPLRLVFTRTDPEARHALPVRLHPRFVTVGAQSRVQLSASGAVASALRAMAAEAGAFFGSPVRTEVA